MARRRRRGEEASEILRGGDDWGVTEEGGFALKYPAASLSLTGGPHLSGLGRSCFAVASSTPRAAWYFVPLTCGTHVAVAGDKAGRCPGRVDSAWRLELGEPCECRGVDWSPAVAVAGFA